MNITASASINQNETVLSFYLNFAQNYINDIMEQVILLFIAYITLAVLLYGFKSRICRIEASCKRVLFVIAHPDDECMFFGPSIIKCVELIKECNIFLLCMSKGNFDGQGPTRSEELWNSCRMLGIPSSNIFLVNHTELPDNPKVKWKEETIGRIILNLVEQLEISTLITFDREGVSRHLNHTALFYSVANLFVSKQMPSYCKVYTLESTNILRKYWFILDVPLSIILSPCVFILKWSQRKQVIKAMYEHKSQLKWFRRLFLFFSRYIIVNTLQEMNDVTLEVDLDENLHF